jgi:hypothetical protein
VGETAAIGSPTIGEPICGASGRTLAAGRYVGRGGRFTNWGGAWYPGGAQGVGCLTGKGTEAAVHGELHAEDEAASAVGRTVAQAGGFTCERRHGVMAELQCSWTMAIVVAGAVSNGHSSARGKRRGEQSGVRDWWLLRV